MTKMTFPAVIMAAIVLSASAAYAQSAPPSPAIKQPNPATSATTDDDGINPLARPGDNSPTGQGPSQATNPPLSGTTGSGVKGDRESGAKPPQGK